MREKSAVFLLLLILVAPTIFLRHEARPLDSPATKENMVGVIRRGGARGGGRNGGSSNGRAIPMIGGASMVPRTSGGASPKLKHNAAHSGRSVSTTALLIIAGFWLQSLASAFSRIYWEM
ncbi:hypothetical protein KSP40_PGU015606 [Platanthera guangdongensis]|uniref:Uncharacterized protein n=1 Tax=Platanthera guangdongensis TaxID=2320717 RepID=A0ABR2LIM6_9ASPA